MLAPLFVIKKAVKALILKYLLVGGGGMKDKRINKPQHIRQILGEQINLLRTKKIIDKAEIEKARAIGYLASVTLTAMKDGELEERIAALEKEAKERENE